MNRLCQMPTYEYGDMFQMFGKTDLFCVTTCSELTTQGRLVMGRGSARMLRDRVPDIDLMIGEMLGDSRILYGLYVVDTPKQKVGAFQTKHNWKHQSYKHIIETSIRNLFDWIMIHRPKRVDLNYPGIGNGKLDIKEIGYQVNLLPDLVHIWRFKK